MSQLSPAIFFDRDGTLIEDVHYCKNPADVRVLPGVLDALRKLKSAGFRHIIITNQSAIGRGYMNESDYDAVHARTLELIGERLLDGAYYCHHHPDFGGVCECRKPAPGLLLSAAGDLGLDLAASWMIGDADTDVTAAHAAGARAVLVAHPRTAHRRSGTAAPEHTAPDLAGAATLIAR